MKEKKTESNHLAPPTSKVEHRYTHSISLWPTDNLKNLSQAHVSHLKKAIANSNYNSQSRNTYQHQEENYRFHTTATQSSQ